MGKYKDFTISVHDKELAELKAKLASVRFPREDRFEKNWDLGIYSPEFGKLINYWINEYDWKKHEAQLNRFHQYKVTIDGIDIHFIWEKGETQNSIPVIFSHGWPDSFLRYTKVIRSLTQKRILADKSELSFDVIIPSVIGFGFSGYSNGVSINNESIADFWCKLMTDKLGYQRFIAAGGDVGSGITRYLAKNHPEHLYGIYLNDVGLIRDLMTYRDDLTDEEKLYYETVSKWMKEEAGYMNIQSTKPQTLAFALSDSPVGLAAWIFEKFHSWGDWKSCLSYEDVITNIMIYWLTNTIYTSCRIYHENSNHLTPVGDITAPAGVSLFSKDINLPPKSWIEKHLNLVHFSHIESGGHFTAMENPDAYCEDFVKFVQLLKL
ncbi:MAG: epoxide hydrolase [Dysgonamonadaceae bacterium]|jgi:microsomal epoxide hydrolase|nr:epoxide hydrolase [Dysgonamonadaceae bacterium]